MKNNQDIEKNMNNWEQVMYKHSKFITTELIKNNKTTNLFFYHSLLKPVKMGMIVAVMEHCKGNKAKSAFLIGVSRGTLKNYLQRFFNNTHIGRLEEKEKPKEIVLIKKVNNVGKFDK